MKLVQPLFGSNMTNMTSMSGLTMVNLLEVVTPTTLDNSSLPTSRPGRTSLNALMYIVVVLFFYSFSLIILMVKYVRREKEEANLRHYYQEFVSRERFRSALFQNKIYMESLLRKQKLYEMQEQNGNKIYCSGSLLKEDSVVEKLLTNRNETIV